MAQLALAHGAHGACVKARAGVNKFIAQCQQLRTQLGCARHGAQLYKRLALVIPCTTARRKVCGKRFKRHGHAPGRPIRAQLQIHFKHAVAPRRNQRHKVFHQPLKVVRVAEHARPARLPRRRVHKHQFDVRCKAKLAAAALAQRAHRQRARAAIRQQRRAMHRRQRSRTQAQRSRHHHLGHIPQLAGELAELCNAALDVAHVDAEHLAVLEVVQGRALRSAVRLRLQAGSQLGGQLRMRARSCQRLLVGHQRQQVVILQAQKVLPQKIAHAQQAHQCVQHRRAVQRGQLTRPVWARKQLPQKLVEVQERSRRVRRVRQQMRKVLDECARSAQLLLPLGRSNARARGICNVQRVLHACPAGLHLHPRNVHALHRQRVGELVQEAHGVRRTKAQQRVARVSRVVDFNFQRRQWRAGGCRLHRGCHAPRQLPARRTALARMQQCQQRLQLARIFCQLLGSGQRHRTRHRLHREHIHNFALRVQCRVAGSRRLVGEHMPVHNIPTMHKQQPADDCQLAQIIIGNDGDAPLPARQRLALHSCQGCAVQRCGQRGVARDLRRAKNLRVGRGHAQHVALHLRCVPRLFRCIKVAPVHGADGSAVRFIALHKVRARLRAAEVQPLRQRGERGFIRRQSVRLAVIQQLQMVLNGAQEAVAVRQCVLRRRRQQAVLRQLLQRQQCICTAHIQRSAMQALQILHHKLHITNGARAQLYLAPCAAPAHQLRLGALLHGVHGAAQRGGLNAKDGSRRLLLKLRKHGAVARSQTRL